MILASSQFYRNFKVVSRPKLGQGHMDPNGKMKKSLLGYEETIWFLTPYKQYDNPIPELFGRRRRIGSAPGIRFPADTAIERSIR